MPQPHRSSLQRGVQSVEIGLRLIAALAEAPRAMTLKDLAAAAAMPASKAHRYLVSFQRAGMVAQAADGRYDLGTLALTAGLTKLSRLDAQRIALDHLDLLMRETNETALMTIWNAQGPVVVRWLEAERAVNVHVRTGAAMPLINSVSGRLFAAYLPATVVGPLIEREFEIGVMPTRRGRRISQPAFLAELDAIRRRGMARVFGDLVRGVSALAAPVFDHQGKLAFGFAVLGAAASFEAAWEGPTAQRLAGRAQACTAALGGLAASAN